MTRDRLNGYGEIIDVLEDLPVILRETRRRKRQTMRAAGEDLGVSGPTILRWEAGTSAIPVTGAVRILRWAAT